jgi:hypothetical protein
MRCLTIEEWKSYVAAYDFGPVPPSRVVLHHTWRPTVSEWRGRASMLGMQTYYHGLGWSSAPHIYVAPDGIWLATPMSDVGVHAGIGNSGYWLNGQWSYSIGLEMVGNYDYQRPDGAVWENARAVMIGLSERLGIAPRQLISFHRDYGSKSCPGWAVKKEWVWGEVEALAPGGGATIDPLFIKSWEGSGGVWKPERLTPGFPLSPAETGRDGNWQQRFERGVAVMVDGQVHWRLLSEFCKDE